MAGPHVDDKKTAAVHTARDERQRQCILRVMRI